MPERDEAHVVDTPCGHELAADCWCEPTVMYWAAIEGAPVFVVEHDDNHTPYAQLTPIESVRADRSRNPDWVTQFLDSVGERKTDGDAL